MVRDRTIAMMKDIVGSVRKVAGRCLDPENHLV